MGARAEASAAEEERKRAIVTRRQVLKNIGDLARGPGAERYAHIKEDEDSFVLDDAPLMRVLALDYGKARCGCAVSDPTGVVVTPIDPVTLRDRGL